MGLSDGKDLGRRAGRDELGQHLAIAVLVILDAAVELAIGEGAGTAFAELDIGIGVEGRAPPEVPGVLSALTYNLPAFEDDWAKAHLREDQSCEQATRTGADDEGTQGESGGGPCG